jgi:hypothetical protein
MAQVTSVATASEPGTRLAASWIEKNRRSRMFDRSTTYPMNRNSGTAVRTSLVVTSNVFCTSSVKIRLSKT